MSNKSATPPKAIADTATRPLNQLRFGGTLLSSANQPFWRLLGAIILGGAGLLLGAYWIGNAGMLTEIPVSMRSALRANYSADPYSVAMQPVKLNLISEVLIDGVNNATGEPVVQLATVVDELRTPVPTITPVGTAFLVATPTLAAPNQPEPTGVTNRTPAPALTQQATLTLTAGQPTATLGLFPTLTSTLGPSPIPTRTLKPGELPTATQFVPTLTYTPTRAGQPTSTLASKASQTFTNTPVLPTKTSIPSTVTPIPPTRTPLPPTSTPRPPTATPVPPTAPPPPTSTPNAYPPPPPASTETVAPYP